MSELASEKAENIVTGKRKAAERNGVPRTGAGRGAESAMSWSEGREREGGGAGGGGVADEEASQEAGEGPGGGRRTRRKRTRNQMLVLPGEAKED